MKTPPKSILFLPILILCLFVGAAHAKAPTWVITRPLSNDYYIGIDKSDKQGSQESYRQAAQNKALFDLSSQISIEIAGEFVDVAVERTGLSEQEVRMEIRAASQAKLSGHELVDEWESRKEYWVYYRISKALYRRLQAAERQKAILSARDMLLKARSAHASAEHVSALRFYFEALNRIQDFVGENLQASIAGQEVFLFNEIYVDLQRLMASLKLTAQRSVLPVMSGVTVATPVSVRASIKDSGVEMGVPGLPIVFSLDNGSGNADQKSMTDTNGIVRYGPGDISATDTADRLRARIDVQNLFPGKDTRRFFQALIEKITIPEADIFLKSFADRENYLWHREFLGQNILIVCDYQVGAGEVSWDKIGDELVNFIKEKDGRIQRLRDPSSKRAILDWLEEPVSAWPLTDAPEADFVFIVQAHGKMKKRENAQNPFGEDVQFAGKISTVVHKTRKLHFSDQYRGATGWNPLGEEMVMDVLALHVFKRWKQQYLKRLME